MHIDRYRLRFNMFGGFRFFEKVMKTQLFTFVGTGVRDLHNVSAAREERTACTFIDNNVFIMFPPFKHKWDNEQSVSAMPN